MDTIHPFADKYIYNSIHDNYIKLVYICHFWVNGKPIPKGSHKAFVCGKRAIITDSQEGLALWQSKIRIEAQKAKSEFPELDWENNCIFLWIDYVFPHPKYHFTSTGKKSKRYTNICINKPDEDKLRRAVCDALTGTLYKDDCQTMSFTGLKLYGNPGIRIQVYFAKEIETNGT